MSGLDSIEAIQMQLTDARAKLLAALADLAPDTLQQPGAGGSWSIKDILAHIAMAEAVNVQFAKLMVAKDMPLQMQEFAAAFPDFPGAFELDKFNAWMAERWRAKSLAEIFAALDATRADTLAWLATLTPAQLERTGAHAVWGKQSVRGMFRILAIHDKFHRGDVLKRKL